MRLNDFIHTLETGRKSISESKAKVANLLALNGIDFDPKVAKKFDSAINHVSKMIISVYTGIKFKVPYVAYSDDAPYFRGEFGLKEGYRLDSELAKCLGIINLVSGDLKKTAGITQVIDHRSMNRFNVKTAVTTSRNSAIKSISEAFISLSGVAVPKDKEETEK